MRDTNPSTCLLYSIEDNTYAEKVKITEFDEELRRSFSVLSPYESLLLYLRFFTHSGTLDYTEIAKIVHKSGNTVKKHVNIALNKLKDSLIERGF